MDAKAPLLLAVLLSYHVTVLAGPLCYDCPKIARAQDCAKTTVCGDDEICYSQRYISTNLNEYYKLGCSPKDVCEQSAFSLFGNNLFPIGKKRQVASAHAQSRRQSSDDMVLCLQCCQGSLCNINLCGSSSATHLKRCFKCDDVLRPHDCDRVIECGNGYSCSVHYSPLEVTYEWRYKMECLPEIQCSVLASVQTNSCMRCCKDRDYCNFNLCDNYTTPSGAVKTTPPVKTTPLPVQTTPTTTPTTTEKPPVVVITPSQHIEKQYTQTVKAYCASAPNVQISWGYTDGSATNSKQLPPGVTDDGSGNLMIAHLNESNSGQYRCVGISPTGALAASFLTVNITATPAIVISVDRTPRGHIAAGDTFSLHCNVIGYPKPIVTWTFTDSTGQATVPNSVVYSNSDRDLTVNQYNPNHNDGKWTCSAKNGFGKSAGNARIP